ncbi:hypothetical protein CsatB_017047 [Cannabis sativa]
MASQLPSLGLKFLTSGLPSSSPFHHGKMQVMVDAAFSNSSTLIGVVVVDGKGHAKEVFAKKVEVS